MSLSKKPYLAAAIIFLLSAYSIFFYLEDDLIIALTKEDGFFESIGAICFLIASIIFYTLFLKDKFGNNFRYLKTNKNLFYLFLCIIFFFGFGEEISWGQRIFHLKTPDIISEHNWQSEINLHNLNMFIRKAREDQENSGLFMWFNIGRAFQAFWICYCIIIPILSEYTKKISIALDKIRLPIVPVWLGTMFAANYILSRILLKLISNNMYRWIIEIKETNYAFLFALVSFYFYKRMKLIISHDKFHATQYTK
ncbi:MAG: hypothetical protein ACFFCW_42850 [Candidatus Hodarchaeota archaeon]